jgi:hypothetical protein
MASAAYQPWPELPYEEFAPTAYFMHMITQVANSRLRSSRNGRMCRYG